MSKLRQAAADVVNRFDDLTGYTDKWLCELIERLRVEVLADAEAERVAAVRAERQRLGFPDHLTAGERRTFVDGGEVSRG